MKIFEAFDPVPVHLASPAFHAERLGSLMRQHTLADGWNSILGSPLDWLVLFWPVRQYEEGFSHDFSRLVRHYFLDYFILNDASLSFGDAGNLRPEFVEQAQSEDWKNLWSELFSIAKTIVCVGGDQVRDVEAAEALAKQGDPVNLCVVDACYDFKGETCDETGSSFILDELLLRLNQKIGFLSFIGIQNFLNPPSLSRQLDKLLFDVLRLSEFRQSPEEAEPLLRLSNMLSWDISALEAAFVPELKGRRPNGLTGVEACRLARYAGFSSSMRFISLRETIFEEEKQPSVTAQMIAQILWHGLDGLASRLTEEAPSNPHQYNQYFVDFMPFTDQPLSFYQHKLSGRWWMELPASLLDSGNPIFRERYIPCSYQDYLQAQRGEWPERWWKAIQRLDLN
jgi:formiminoglutamase